MRKFRSRDVDSKKRNTRHSMLTLSILCLWLSSPSSGATVVPLTQLQPQFYLFDFIKSTGFFIEDGRLDGFQPLFITTSTNGWFLWESSQFRPPRIVQLEHDGTFINFVALDKINGWETGFGIRSAYGYKTNHALITLEKYSFENPDHPETVVADLNLKTLKLNKFDLPQQSESGIRWVPFTNESQIIKMDTIGGSILLGNSKGKNLKVLKKEKCTTPKAQKLFTLKTAYQNNSTSRT